MGTLLRYVGSEVYEGENFTVGPNGLVDFDPDHAEAHLRREPELWERQVLPRKVKGGDEHGGHR